METTIDCLSCPNADADGDDNRLVKHVIKNALPTFGVVVLACACYSSILT